MTDTKATISANRRTAAPLPLEGIAKTDRIPRCDAKMRADATVEPCGEILAGGPARGLRWRLV